MAPRRNAAAAGGAGRQAQRPLASPGAARPLLVLLLLAAAAAAAAAPAAGDISVARRRPLSLFGGGARAGAPVAPTADQCRAAAGGHVFAPHAAYGSVAEWLGFGDAFLKLPQEVTDVTTLSTIVQLVAPGLQLVLDPLLFLQARARKAGADANGGAALPRLIHMTLRSKHRVLPHQVLSILSWGKLHPSYALLVYDDADVRAYVARYHREFLPTFDALGSPVERADAWRYHALCSHGGIYADTDTVCAAPFDEWAPRALAAARAGGRAIPGYAPAGAAGAAGGSGGLGGGGASSSGAGWPGGGRRGRGPRGAAAELPGLAGGADADARKAPPGAGARGSGGGGFGAGGGGGGVLPALESDGASAQLPGLAGTGAGGAPGGGGGGGGAPELLTEAALDAAEEDAEGLDGEFENGDRQFKNGAPAARPRGGGGGPLAPVSLAASLGDAGSPGDGAGLVVGIENVFGSQEEAEERTYVKKIQMIQWTLAARRGHPTVCRMGSRIKRRLEQEAADAQAAALDAALRRVEAFGGTRPRTGAAAAAAAPPPPAVGHDAAVLLRTGPGIWTDSVHDYIREHNMTPEALVFGGRAGDALVLPQLALGCNVRYWSGSNNASLVYHMYNNSWKTDHFQIADAKKAARRRKKALETAEMLLLVGGAGAAVAGAAWAAAALAGPGLLRKRRRVARND